MACKQHLDSRCVFAVGSIGAGGPNGPDGPNENTCVCGLVPTAPTKTRLESRFCNKQVRSPFDLQIGISGLCVPAAYLMCVHLWF